jgi:hypothetical protein
MKQPFVYDTEDDISRLQVVLDIPADTPIHLTTALAPLPEELRGLDHLVYLHVKHGNKRSENHEMDIICSLKNLETLILERNIPGGRIPDTFYELSNLKELTIHNTWFPHGAFTEDIRKLSKLESLEIGEGLYKGKLPDAIGELKELKRLIVLDKRSYLEGGSDISVPDTIWNLTKLRELRIGPGVYREEPISLDRIPELTALEAFEFLIPVKSIPDAFWQLPNLTEVYIRAIEQKVVPSLAETQLRSLVLDMTLSSIPDLPETLEKLSIASSEIPSLKNTTIRDLSISAKTIPELPATVEILNLNSLPLKTLPGLPPLKQLKINSCYYLEELPKLPETLAFLVIGHCTKLSALPENLHLERLWLSHCSSLSSLPSKLVVDTLIIDFCEKLTELPDDLVVLSKVQLTGIPLSKTPKFPDNVKVTNFDDY